MKGSASDVIARAGKPRPTTVSRRPPQMPPAPAAMPPAPPEIPPQMPVMRPRNPAIYKELMQKHDRMNPRYIKTS